MNFIGVLNEDNRIVEYNRQGASLPDSNATTKYIEVTEQQNTEIRTTKQLLTNDGRAPIVYFTDELGVYAGDDLRSIFDVNIETPNPEIIYNDKMVDYISADNNDLATVTITMVDGEGATIPYTGSRVVSFFGDRFALLNYVSGVAVKTFKTDVSGFFTLTSTNEYKLLGEVNLLAVEI